MLPVFYEPETREDFFSLGFDYIADCIDSTRSKLDLIETAITRGVPIISSMGTGNRLDPSKFRITDLSKTSGCPLAKVMRRELRARGIKHHTVLASEELPLYAAEASRAGSGQAHAAGLCVVGPAVRRYDDRGLYRAAASRAESRRSNATCIKSCLPCRH